jgi:hypothetical protein
LAHPLLVLPSLRSLTGGGRQDTRTRPGTSPEVSSPSAHGGSRQQVLLELPTFSLLARLVSHHCAPSTPPRSDPALFRAGGALGVAPFRALIIPKVRTHSWVGYPRVGPLSARLRPSLKPVPFRRLRLVSTGRTRRVVDAAPSLSVRRGESKPRLPRSHGACSEATRRNASWSSLSKEWPVCGSKYGMQDRVGKAAFRVLLPSGCRAGGSGVGRPLGRCSHGLPPLHGVPLRRRGSAFADQPSASVARLTPEGVSPCCSSRDRGHRGWLVSCETAARLEVSHLVAPELACPCGQVRRSARVGGQLDALARVPRCQDSDKHRNAYHPLTSLENTPLFMY